MLVTSTLHCQVNIRTYPASGDGEDGRCQQYAVVPQRFPESDLPALLCRKHGSCGGNQGVQQQYRHHQPERVGSPMLRHHRAWRWMLQLVEPVDTHAQPCPGQLAILDGQQRVGARLFRPGQVKKKESAQENEGQQGWKTDLPDASRSHRLHRSLVTVEMPGLCRNSVTSAATNDPSNDKPLAIRSTIDIHLHQAKKSPLRERAESNSCAEVEETEV